MHRAKAPAAMPRMTNTIMESGNGSFALATCERLKTPQGVFNDMLGFAENTAGPVGWVLTHHWRNWWVKTHPTIYRKPGYRLVYEVVDDRLVILVIAIGKRNHAAVYEKAGKR